MDYRQEAEYHYVDIESNCLEEVSGQVELEAVLPTPTALLAFLLLLLLLLVEFGPVDFD